MSKNLGNVIVVVEVIRLKEKFGFCSGMKRRVGWAGCGAGGMVVSRRAKRDVRGVQLDSRLLHWVVAAER